VLLAGKLVNGMPLPWRFAMVTAPIAGQLPAGTELEQVTAVQFKPVAAGSRNTVPFAGLGPWFATVMVYVVVWPAVNEATELVFAIDKLAAQSGLPGGLAAKDRDTPSAPAVLVKRFGPVLQPAAALSFVPATVHPARPPVTDAVTGVVENITPPPPPPPCAMWPAR
jgi:hypothetical protein